MMVHTLKGLLVSIVDQNAVNVLVKILARSVLDLIAFLNIFATKTALIILILILLFANSVLSHA